MIRILLALAIVLTPSSAWAMKLSLVAGANLSEPEAKPAVATYKSEEDFGGGALLEFGLVPSVGLEFGALYMPRKYDMTNTTSRVNVKLKMYQFPVLLKAYLADVLSIGVGGYYASYNKKIEYTVESLSGVTSTTATTAASLHEDSDFGVVTSLGIYIPFTKMSRFLLDARYNIGVKDNSTSNAELRYTDIQVLAGIQFGF